MDDFAYHRRQDLPTARHLEYRLEMIRMDESHHPFLRLGHQ